MITVVAKRSSQGIIGVSGIGSVKMPAVESRVSANDLLHLFRILYVKLHISSVLQPFRDSPSLNNRRHYLADAAL